MPNMIFEAELSISRLVCSKDVALVNASQASNRSWENQRQQRISSKDISQLLQGFGHRTYRALVPYVYMCVCIRRSDYM
jgi:hypothetical protein